MSSFFGFVFAGALALAQSPSEVYVQAASAKLKVEAKAGSADVHTVSRGATLKVLSAQGSWYQVEVDGKKGWISKLFTSPNKPVGQAEVFQTEEVSKEKVSRKRSSNYSVTAATRGLSAGGRQGGGREQFRSNDQELERMEGQKVDPKILEQFEKEGHTNQGN